MKNNLKLLEQIEIEVSSFYKNIKSSNELKKLSLKEIKLKKFLLIMYTSIIGNTQWVSLK